MRGEAARAGPPRRRNRWLLALVATGAIALYAAIWIFSSNQTAVETPNQSENSDGTADTGRFSPKRPITQEDLETLRWEEVNQLLQVVSTDAVQIQRLILASNKVDTPPATYLRALLLILQQKPEQALVTFGILDPQAIPPVFLYAPFRLHETLRPAGPSPYLIALQKAVSEDKVPALIRARILARDGDLSGALGSYLRTDPGGWASYDLESLERIGTHQGLAADLRKLIAGALASGRVKTALAPTLYEIAHQKPALPEIEAFKLKLRQSIEEGTPAGRLAIESAKKLIDDRNRFLRRDYAALIEAHRNTNPIELPTETVLLLFLSAVELKQQVAMDQWGQELKRRHAGADVRDWVIEMTTSAQ